MKRTLTTGLLMLVGLALPLLVWAQRASRRCDAAAVLRVSGGTLPRT
jgi:hypothetical protein